MVSVKVDALTVEVVIKTQRTVHTTTPAGDLHIQIHLTQFHFHIVHGILYLVTKTHMQEVIMKPRTLLAVLLVAIIAIAHAKTMKKTKTTTNMETNATVGELRM